MELTHATRALRARIRSTVSPAHALQASEDQHVVRVSNFPDVKGEIRKGIFCHHGSTFSLWATRLQFIF